MHAPSCNVAVDRTGFDDRLIAVRAELTALWEACEREMPEAGPSVGWFRKRSNARATRRLIDELADEIERLPRHEPARAAWRDTVRRRLQQFGEDRLNWPDGYRRLLFGDQFYKSAIDFVRDARAFDPTVRLADIGQALRNVWIGNSFQMLLDRPAALRPGLFGYSMLYPVTDNWLDDPAVSPQAKRSFNEWLARRLAGEPVRPRNRHEADVARLVEQIEHERSRDRSRSLYLSLLAINDAQTASLCQHREARLSDRELLAISMAKGGSSVLVDLHLVTPAATAEEERFAFAYGVCLQLLDDVQDVDADLGANHQTLFTSAARSGALDEVAARLAHFIDAVLLRSERFADPVYADRIDLIHRNCVALLVGSVADQPARFSRRFRRRLARSWPVSFRSHRRLRRRALRQWSRLSGLVEEHAPNLSRAIIESSA
jgi:hypothetical protein